MDYLDEDIYYYSEFHASCEAIIRQLPKVTDTYMLREVSLPIINVICQF